MYVRDQLGPQHGEVAAAIGPIVRASRAKGNKFETTRAEQIAMELSRSLNALPRRLTDALVTPGGEPEQIVSGVQDQVASLASLIETMGWQDPGSLARARQEIGRLDRLLQWEKIQAKVVE